VATRRTPRRGAARHSVQSTIGPMTWLVRSARQVFAAGVALWLSGCAVAEPTGTGTTPSGAMPILAITANPRPIPAPQPADFVAAVDSSMGVGARGMVQSWTWSALEPDSARLNVQQLLADVRYVRSRGLTSFVGLQLINTVKREVPADLNGVPWDDPRMLRRFERLLDALAPILPEVTYLSVGNEVAGYLARSGEWSPYISFLTGAVAAAHRRAPNIKVGATLEYVEASSQTTRTRALIAVSDVAIFTLYPFQLESFDVAPPTISNALFDNMLILAGEKPVVLQELGYPASSLNKSSEAMQAAFFTDAIAQWRERRARMPFVSLFMLHDFTQQQCAELGVYYNLPNQQSFLSFLCTIGLRRADGSARPSWDAVRSAAAWLRAP
jgi:hypothetical protein